MNIQNLVFLHAGIVYDATAIDQRQKTISGYKLFPKYGMLNPRCTFPIAAVRPQELRK